MDTSSTASFDIFFTLENNIKNLPNKYKKFLQSILNSIETSTDVSLLEEQANDIGFIQNFLMN